MVLHEAVRATVSAQHPTAACAASPRLRGSPAGMCSSLTQVLPLTSWERSEHGLPRERWLTQAWKTWVWSAPSVNNTHTGTGQDTGLWNGHCQNLRIHTQLYLVGHSHRREVWEGSSREHRLLLNFLPYSQVPPSSFHITVMEMQTKHTFLGADLYFKRRLLL